MTDSQSDDLSSNMSDPVALAVRLLQMQSGSKEPDPGPPGPEVPGFWKDIVEKSQPEYSPDAGLSKAILAAIRTHQYVDFRLLVGQSLSQKYDIRQEDWARAMTKYGLIMGKGHPDVFWQLHCYRTIVEHLSEGGWALAREYDRIFRSLRAAPSVVNPETRFPWASLHVLSHQSAQIAVQNEEKEKMKKEEEKRKDQLEKRTREDRRRVQPYQRPFRGGGQQGGQKPCFNFRNGKCDRGRDACKYSHVCHCGVAHDTTPCGGSRAEKPQPGAKRHETVTLST